MQTYQKRQARQQVASDKPALSKVPDMTSNQLALKTMGNDEKNAASQGLLDNLRSRIEKSSETDRKAFDTLHNVNAEQGRKMELDKGIRSKLESMTGYNLSGVKIRESRQAADMGARAFAKGNVIHFAPGQYRPESKSGQHMIAHEVAHVVQQARGGIKPDTHMLNVNTDSALESSADRMASQFISGEQSLGASQSLTALPAMSTATAPVQGLFGNFGKKLKEFVSSVGSGIATGAKSAWSGAKKAGTKVSDFMGKAIDKTGIGLSYLGGKIADGASYLGGKIATGAKSAWEGTQKVGRAIGKGAGYVAGKVGDGLGWAGGKIADGASYLGGKIATGAKSAWEGAGKIGSAAAKKMGELADKTGLTYLGKKIGQGASYVADKTGLSYVGKKVAQGASYVGGKIADGAGYLGGKIATGAKSAWEGAQKFGKWVGKGAGYVGGKIAKGASFVGSKIAKGASFVGGKIASGARSAWEAAKDFAEDIRESHHNAVDELNNNRDEYNKLSLKKRLMWMAKNPLARLFAASDKEDTKKRNAHKVEIDEAAEKLKKSRGTQDQDTLTNEELDYAKGGNERGTNLDAQDKVDEINDYVGKASSVASGAGKAVTKASEKVSVLSSLSGAGKVMSHIGSGLDVAGGALSAVKTGMGAYNKFKDGDYAGGAAGVFDTMRGAATTGVGAANLAASIAPQIAGTVGGNVIPGLNIAVGGAQAASGAIRLGSALSSNRALGKRLEKYATPGDKTDRSKIYDKNMTRAEKVLHAAKSTSKIKATEAGFDVGSGALKAAGGALSFAPVPGLGAAVGALGTVGDVAKSLVSSKMKSTQKKDALNREFNLDGEIEDYMKTHKDTNKRDAQKIILKSRGFKTGSRDEAYTSSTARNAIWLHQQASKPGPDGDEARATLKDMGLHHSGKDLSIQAVAEKLGLEEGADWRKQLKKASKTTPSWRDDL